MFDIREHGGAYGSGKYRKYAMVDIANLSHPTSYPINKLYPNSGYNESILKIINGYLYRVATYSGTMFIYKYAFTDDGLGSVTCNQIGYASLANNNTPFCLLYVPGQTDLLFGAGTALYKLNPNTLNITGTVASYAYNVVGLNLLSNGNILVIHNSTNNGSKEIRVLNSSYNQISVKSISTTYLPVILPDGKVSYSDSSQNTYIYDPYTNTDSALMFSGSQSITTIINNYDSNSSSYGLSFGDIFVIAYQSAIRFYNYSGGKLTFIATITPNSSTYANIVKLDENTIYVLESGNEYLVNVTTKAITSPSKPISDRAISSNTTQFLAFEFPKAGKSFICSTSANGFFSPVFKTKIIN